MKKKLLFIVYSITLTCYAINTNAQANTELSNLVSPTKVNQSLLPNNDNIRNLGSATRSWKDLYIDGSVYLGGARFLAYKAGTGTGNTAIGSNVLNANTSGFSNTGAGFNALFSNTTGYFNTANGSSALYSNTIGYFNTANGGFALSANTTGNYNTANGSFALYANTTGYSNTANGYIALYANTTGRDNTANGNQALYANTTGYYNTANGSFALSANTTGYFNTANGFGAGSFNNNNANCTFLGYDADQSVTTDFTNSTALGSYSRITASNQVRIGNSSITSIGGYEPWTNLSDGRFKKNVKENVPGLAFINQLHAVTYTMDVTKLRNFLGEDRQDETTAKDKTVSKKNPEAEALTQKGIQEKEKIIRTGFVAQQVEEAAKKIEYDFSGVDKPANEHTPYGLRYSEFVVPLVKAVQELSQENNDLKKRIEKLEAMMNRRQSSLNVSSAALEQNLPNPFTNSTTIHYTLPEKFSSARIIITDKSGKSLKELNVSGSGKGSINVNAAMLSSGAYQYSLYIDGRLIDTKQMEHIK